MDVDAAVVGDYDDEVEAAIDLDVVVVADDGDGVAEAAGRDASLQAFEARACAGPAG